ERLAHSGPRRPSSGSSPRVWGTRGPALRRCSLSRFIPTCVGNARQSLAEDQDSTVHPHVWGERGGVMTCKLSSYRFIPTCVGNARQSLAEDQDSTVHPHGWGE